MAVGVLCAVGGPAESLLVRAAERSRGRAAVTRRCADLTELLGVAEAGLGRVAVVPADLDGLDREAVDALRRAGVRVVGLAGPDRPWRAERLHALGVDLVVAPPEDDDAAEGVLDRLLEVLESDPGPADPAPPPQDGGAEPPRGRLVAVWGPTGAPGRTTVAVNLAAELAGSGRSCVLADADTYGGSVAQVVGLLDEAPGLAAAARSAGQGVLDVRTLGRLAPVVAERLRVLSGISRPDRWPELPGPSLDVVWEVSRALAQWTVVDCGFCLEEDEVLSYDTRAPRRNAATTSALAAADVVVAVGVADPVGIHRLVRALGDLADRVPGTPRTVVVNRVRASVAGARPQDAVRDALARYAGVTAATLLPDDRAAVDAALLEARTLREVAPSSPVRRAIAALAEQLDAALPQEARERAAVAGGR
ncbi:AAA family ATPase [Cellulomonas massiliensis]|uniref:AAA family ATPase n=1 Tax=Cellulomonas massiliensis TaxID=1465811 RepID=UPI0002F7CBB9|nr:hypothetical protein [Cellulomonas massiliensis]